MAFWGGACVDMGRLSYGPSGVREQPVEGLADALDGGLAGRGVAVREVGAEGGGDGGVVIQPRRQELGQALLRDRDRQGVQGGGGGVLGGRQLRALERRDVVHVHAQAQSRRGQRAAL